MSERPTPEQVASTYKGGVRVLRRLESHGYVVVHPDDVPVMEFGDGVDDGYVTGFNDGRGAVLGLWSLDDE